MAKLADYELANIALWSFDFANSMEVFSRVVEEFREKQDLFGTIGALEGARVSEQLIADRWKLPKSSGLEKILGKKTEFTIAPPQMEIKDPRAAKFNARLLNEQKRIAERIQRHRARLGPASLEFIGHSDKEAYLEQIARVEYRDWFISVQRLPSVCFGRSYRRDGLVGELGSLSKQLTSEGVANEPRDSRFISATVDEVELVIWFDGRVSCIGTPNQFDRIRVALQTIADICDRVIAEEH